MAKSSGFASAIDTHDGLGGPFSRTIFRRLATQPPEPTGGDLTVSPNIAPTDWFFEPPVGTIQLWKSVVRYVPGGDVYETTCITYSGISGETMGIQPVFEDGFFDVSGTPGTDIEPRAEISTVTTLSTGISGEQVVIGEATEDGFFDVSGTPGTDVLPRAEISTVTAAAIGVSGEQVVVLEATEDGFFDVSGTPGTDILPSAEISTVTTTIGGIAGTLTNVPAGTEVQTLFQGGALSNVVGDGSMEVIPAGVETDNTTTFSSGSRSWPLGTNSGTLLSGWSYSAGNGTSQVAGPRIINNTGAAIDLTGALYEYSVEVFSAANLASFQINFETNIDQRTVQLQGTPTFPGGLQTTVITFSGTVGVFDSPTDLIENGDYIYPYVSNQGGQPFTYRINSFTITPASGFAADYTLELGTLPTTPTGTATLTNNFGNNLGPTAALTSIQSAIEGNWDNVSTTVTEVVTTTDGDSTTSISSDTSTAISTGDWDFRTIKGRNGVSLSAGATAWTDLINATDSNWFGYDPSESSGDFVTAINTAVGRGFIDNSTLTLTSASGEATFEITRVRLFTSDYWFELKSIIGATTGVPITSGPWTNINFTIGTTEASLLIDTNQAAAISPAPVWTIDPNLGTTGTIGSSQDTSGATTTVTIALGGNFFSGFAQGSAAGGTASSYTVFENNGAELGEVTGATANEVNVAIISLINADTQTPVNFNSGIESTLTLTALGATGDNIIANLDGTATLAAEVQSSDTTLALQATRLAGVIDSNANYSASSVGAVITITGQTTYIATFSTTGTTATGGFTFGDDIILTAATANTTVNDLWQVVVENSGGDGDITYGNSDTDTNGFAEETVEGSPGGLSGSLDIWSVTLNGTPYTGTFTSGANDNEQATQIAAQLNAIP